MAEWSNAVDSKSIVLLSGYLGFESLSLRHLQQSPLYAGFVVNDEEGWGSNPREKGLTTSERQTGVCRSALLMSAVNETE